MSTPAPRVAARYFVLLADLLREQGADVNAILRAAGLDAGRLGPSDAWLQPDEVERLIAAARAATGRTDLGFELGRRIKMTSHDLLGYGMLSCRSFDEVLRLVARHYHLMTETFTLRYQRAGAGVGEAVYAPALAMPAGVLHFYEEVLAMAHHHQVGLMLGSDVPGHDYHLSLPEPPHVARYASLAPARFHFGSGTLPGVRVVMGADLLDRPLPLGNPRLMREIDERCRAIGRRPPAADSGWGEYVKMMLREARGELLTLAELAQRVRVSARTIDRHLKKEQLQFRNLARQVQIERACELLAAPGTTVAQVALELGYSDAANFSRAFRRELGMPPGDYQQQRAAAPAGRAAADAPTPTR